MNETKIKKIMSEFIAQACTATYYDESTNTFRKCTPKLYKGACFCVELDRECDDPFIVILYNLKDLTRKNSKAFRKNFIKDCPSAKGFANITISLLHEVGHVETEDEDFGKYDRAKELKKIYKLPKEKQNAKYFKLPDEVAATEWAQEWLQNKDNRKLAKKFEKKFFSCFS